MPNSGDSRLSAYQIAMGYTVIVIFWIAFSDMVVTRLNLPPEVMMSKGVAFVFVTDLLLYFTIRRLVQIIRLTSQERNEAARQYQTLVETSNEGICLLDESGIISFLNNCLAAMLGYPTDEIQYKQLEDFIKKTFAHVQQGEQLSNTQECKLRVNGVTQRSRKRLKLL